MFITGLSISRESYRLIFFFPNNMPERLWVFFIVIFWFFAVLRIDLGPTSELHPQPHEDFLTIGFNLLSYTTQ
jgi:hypothetical protein